MKQSTQINEALNILPIAEENKLFNLDGKEIENFKAITVNNEVVACPTKKYVLVQHKDAFRPIVEGLTLTGKSEWFFSIYNTPKRAELKVYLEEATLNGDKVCYGFKAINGFDGLTSIHYNFSNFMKKTYIELVGYRLACKNGMTIRVPLYEAEFVRLEERTKIVNLLKEAIKIPHIGTNVELKIQSMQYLTEALVLLKNPIQRIIQKAKKLTIEDTIKAKNLIKLYIGKRLRDKILDRYLINEEKTLWGLYNAVTYVASHEDIASSTQNGLINRSGEMLTTVLVPQKK